MRDAEPEQSQATEGGLKRLQNKEIKELKDFKEIKALVFNLLNFVNILNLFALFLHIVLRFATFVRHIDVKTHNEELD